MSPRSVNDDHDESSGSSCDRQGNCSDDLKDTSSTSRTSTTSTSIDSSVASFGTVDVRVSSKPKRNVTFAANAKVRQVSKITRDQGKNVWFTGDELMQMKRSFQPTVQRMMNNTLTEEDMQGEEFCTRGLEYRTRVGAKKRMRNKLNGTASVLHEQDRQIFEGLTCRDEEALAKAYQSVNFHCAAEARALGEQDAIDIEEYMATNTVPVYDEDISSSSSDPLSLSATSSHSDHSRARTPIPRLKSGSKRLAAKIASTGSFRGIRRVLSGSKSKLLGRSQPTTVTVPVPVQ